MTYSWVLFDADDTLFHFDAFAGLKMMFSRFLVDFSASDYKRYQAVNKPLWVAYQSGRISARELQTIRFEVWAERLNVSTERLNAAFLAAMADIAELLPGAAELIAALSGHCRMGIITNGFTDLQRARLERTGLNEVFDPVVISEQVGVAKPDRRIFDHALAWLGDPPRDRVLMVGDNPHSDILGGINAGIRTCWVNVHRHSRPKGIEPDHEVASLDDLRTLLLSPQRGR